MTRDELYMKKALELAEIAAEQGEVPVGAIVVKRSSGEIIGRGFNRREYGRSPLTHAELVAIEEAVRDNGSLKKAVAAENVKYLPVFVLLIGCNVSKNFAMFYALNPSYVAALMYIYILWIALFNLLKARLTPNVPYNRMNVKAALLLLTSAIVLILASG